MDIQEAKHTIEVLEETKKALTQKDPVKLKELSNQKIHLACLEQDSGSITLAVIIYSLSKIVEREDYKKIANWDNFVKKFNSIISLAISALKEEKEDIYQKYLKKARKTFISISVNIKPYIQEIIQKASINKASKVYEHGISIGKTAELLGLSQWEIAEYTGQTKISDTPYNKTLDVKKRVQIAMEFFS